ncbi:hypothetical protein, partial [Pseudomonas sp. FSL R10-1339]|uniref:hypothetical protein n=1 Tax=Pseudomonas sp. FSL R10-1339 TaxID=2662196 RepID=UPI001C49C830
NKFCGDGLIGLRYAVLATILYVQSLAMQNSGGAMFKLLQQTESFAKRNFEINFSKNGELGRRCKNSQPSPTLGTLSTFNQPSFP